MIILFKYYADVENYESFKGFGVTTLLENFYWMYFEIAVVELRFICIPCKVSR